VSRPSPRTSSRAKEWPSVVPQPHVPGCGALPVAAAPNPSGLAFSGYDGRQCSGSTPGMSKWQRSGHRHGNASMGITAVLSAVWPICSARRWELTERMGRRTDHAHNPSSSREFNRARRVRGDITTPPVPLPVRQGDEASSPSARSSAHRIRTGSATMTMCAGRLATLPANGARASQTPRFSAVARLAPGQPEHYTDVLQDVRVGRLTASLARTGRRRPAAGSPETVVEQEEDNHGLFRPAWTRWPASLRRCGPLHPSTLEYPSRPGRAGHDRSTIQRRMTDCRTASRARSRSHHPPRAPGDGEFCSNRAHSSLFSG